MAPTDPKTHPSAERVTAFAERRLSSRDAAAVEAHLADCDECRELYIDMCELLDQPLPPFVDPPVPLIENVVSFLRKPKVAAATLLAAAASLTLAVSPYLSLFRGATPYQQLVTAVGTNRTVEGRLTGGFAHGPLRSVTRSQDQPDADFAVLAAAARIQQDAERERTPDNLHAMGVADLVVGRLDAAVARLEESLAAKPDAPATLSDLSAAYLARATRGSRPEDLPKSLDAAQRAIALDQSLSEAYFNRARAAEALNLRDLAIQSWREYVSRDANSQWADEARRRLADLEASRPFDSWMRERNVLPATPTSERVLVPVPDEAVYAAGRIVEDELLPRWARARLASDETGAAWNWSLASRIAADIETRSDDGSIGDLLRSVSSDSSDSLIAAYAAYGDARKHYEDDRIAAAESTFARIEPVLTRVRSPLEHWVRFYLAVAAYQHGQSLRALEWLDGIGACDPATTYFALCGRVTWMRGLIAATESRLQDSLDEYQRAVDFFTRGGYSDQVGSVENLRADVLAAFGQAALAWRHRLIALQQVPVGGDARRRHAVLVSAAAAARREDMRQAAILFQSEALSSAERWGRTTAILEAHNQLAQALVVNGQHAAASAEVAHAKSLLASVPDESLRRRVEVDLLVAESTILRVTNPRAAAALVGAAIERYQQSGAEVHLPRLHLARARAHMAAGDHSSAESDLEAGANVLERQLSGLPSYSARVFRINAHWDLFTLLAELCIDAGKSTQAIDALERGRRMIANRAAPATHGRSSPALRDAVVLYYLVAPDRLRVAAITDGTVAWKSVNVPRSDVAGLVETLGRLVHERADTREVAERLHDIVIAPVAETIGSHRVLLIVADGPLHNAPFAAFRSRATGRSVSQDHLVAVTRSLADAALPSRVSLDTQAFVVADPATRSTLPRLAGATREADAVAATLSRVQVVRNDDATIDAVVNGTREAGWVHIAAHAILDSSQPERTRLMLAPAHGDSGELRIDAISRLRLRPDTVVVLASCRGAASAARGAALVSLASAFLQAGASIVVAPLWDIDDVATETFFKHFYARLAADRDVLEAARGAQQDLVATSDSADLSAWAAFQVYVAQVRQGAEE